MKFLIALGSVTMATVIAYLIGKSEGWNDGWLAHEAHTEDYVNEENAEKTKSKQNGDHYCIHQRKFNHSQ